MKAAVTTAIGREATVVELDIAEPIEREVLVEVLASGICHSDLHASELDHGLPLPMVLGHEVAGRVRAVGPNVVGLRPGDYVVACEVSNCGRCRECLLARPYACTDVASTERRPGQPPRLSYDGRAVLPFAHIGGFAEYILVHENSLAVVPDQLPPAQAAILGCAVVTGAGAAINTAQVRVGDTVAVIGCGGVGLSAVQGAALAGARTIIAIDLHESKLDLARRFGATHTIAADQTDVVAAVHEATSGVGVRYAFEAIGRDQTTQQALEMIAPGGTAFLIGVHGPGAVLSYPAFDFVIQKKSLHSVYMGSTNFRYDIPLYADLYLQGRFNLDDLVAEEISLAELDAGMQTLRTGRSARSVITSFSDHRAV
jgi:S-(hydroxymethyl)glutathione dehydrogenase/alcohol dehydrogenase